MSDKKYLKRKETIYSFICDDLYVPMKIKEIMIMLEIGKDNRAVLEQILDELIEEGKIEITKKGRYQKATAKEFTGTFVGHKDGFGFIVVEGQDEDYFVGKDNVNNAMQNDVVKAVLIPGRPGKRKEAKVLEIIERGFTEVVGTFEDNGSFGFVVCDNTKIDRDIFIPESKKHGAVHGSKVVCHIDNYGDERHSPEGNIIEILGHKDDPGVDILSIVKAYNLPVEFPQKVLNQAETVNKPVSDADMLGRKDLRGQKIVTIDGEDTKDIDDAISLEKAGDNYILGVHIADVTNYVQERSALDVEALKRGTSVYLADRVIPMLPHALSNGICSLNEGVDRLALSCIMTINPKGEIVDHEICETVINSTHRMTYTSVSAIIEHNDASESEKYADVCDMLKDMYTVSKLLRANRQKRGAIDFDFPEAKLLVDADGKVSDIVSVERNEAHKLIEDFMLAANETVAEHFYWQQSPFVYRIHTKPDPEKLSKLNTLMGKYGYSLKGNLMEIHPKEIQKLLTWMEDSEAKMMLSRLTLRAMQQAKYSVDNEGHFGIAAKYYCHFTSPIRRYPDLQIHRIIKDHLRGRWNAKRFEHYNSILPVVATETSRLERRAEETEREVEKLKKCQYMSSFIGEEFTGVISGVTSWGLYVELPNTVEGLVHVSTLMDDHYVFSEDTNELIGERRNRHFVIGQEVSVVLESVDDVTRTIDFTLSEFSKFR